MGRISRSLFCTDTTKDVARLAAIVNNVVNTVSNQGDATSTHLRLLHTAVNHTTDILRSLEAEVALNEGHIVQLLQNMANVKTNIGSLRGDVDAIGNVLVNVSNYVTHIVDRKAAILTKLEVYAITLNSFLTGLTDLANGTLSPHLIPPHILASTL